MSRYAIANGNWSDPAIWNGGTLPLAGETVRPNNFTVTIDITTPSNMTIRTNASAPAVQGGTFILNSGCVFNGDIYFDVPVNNYPLPALSYSGIGIGQINGTLYYNSSSTGNRVVEFSGSGQLNINGNPTVLTSSVASRLIGITGVTTGTLNLFGNMTLLNNTSGIISAGTQPNINVIGNVIAQVGSSLGIYITSGVSNISVTGSVVAGSGGGHGIYLATASTVNVTGNVIGSSASLTTYGIYCLVAANVTVNGTITAQNGAGVYVTNANATIIANGIVTGSSLNNGIYNNAGITTFSGLLIQNGDFAAILSQRLVINSTNVISSKIKDSVGGFRYMYTAGVALGNPLESDVRNLITFGPNNELTGTLIVPDPSDVRKSVPTDNTIGTADLTAQDIFDAIANSSDPIAKRLRNVSTVDITGDQISSI